VENMQNEIRYSKYLETGEQVVELDLKIFLRLFVNHRPVYGIGKTRINEALAILTENKEEKGVLTAGLFIILSFR
jgi:hypothetical protein